MTKKRILVLVAIVLGITAIIYSISVSTKNFALIALSPFALGFLICPLMCAAMGGGLWLANRLSRKKEKVNSQNGAGCCSQHHHDNVAKNYNMNGIKEVN